MGIMHSEQPTPLPPSSLVHVAAAAAEVKACVNFATVGPNSYCKLDPTSTPLSPQPAYRVRRGGAVQNGWVVYDGGRAAWFVVWVVNHPRTTMVNANEMSEEATKERRERLSEHRNDANR